MNKNKFKPTSDRKYCTNDSTTFNKLRSKFPDHDVFFIDALKSELGTECAILRENQEFTTVHYLLPPYFSVYI